jgi:hypothetical protein
MPCPELAAEVAAQLSGEEDIDPIIRDQVRHARAVRLTDEQVENIRDELRPRGRELPWAFIEKVRHAQEYAHRHLGLDEDECCRRKRSTDDWFDWLRMDRHYDDWLDNVLEPVRETPAQKEERAVAAKRAEALLRSVLSPKQLKELDRRGYFHVTVAKRRFRITRGRSHNIKEVDSRSRILRTLCAHPREQVPDADTMLAQKLWLESKPEDFFKIANVQRHRSRSRAPARPLDGVGGAVIREVIRRDELLERAALDATAAGVEPIPVADEPAPVALPEGDVRAA